MKLITTILSILFTCLSANIFAQAPDLINYQALAYDASGNTIKNTAISIRVSILQSSSSGTIAYQETHNPATDGSGAFDIRIGGGSPQQGTFSSIDWGAHSHYLRIEMDASGGTNYTVMGTSQMVSVPYAKYAETAGSLGAGVTGALHNKIYKAPNLEWLPVGCDTSSSAYPETILAIAANNTANEIHAIGGTYVKDFTYNPSTLAVTSSVFASGGITFSSGTISSDFNTITLYYSYPNSGSSSTCSQLRYVFTRQ